MKAIQFQWKWNVAAENPSQFTYLVCVADFVRNVWKGRSLWKNWNQELIGPIQTLKGGMIWCWNFILTINRFSISRAYTGNGVKHHVMTGNGNPNHVSSPVGTCRVITDTRAPPTGRLIRQASSSSFLHMEF